MHSPTEQQAQIRAAAVDLLSAPRGIIKSVAGAGCGKTTTLIGAAIDCKEAGASRLCYLALSKNLVESAQESFRGTATVKTFSALAYEGTKIGQLQRPIGPIYPHHVVESFGLASKRLPTDATTFARIVLAILSSFCQSSATEPSQAHLPYWVKDPQVGGLAIRYADFLFKGLCPGVRTALPLPHDVYVKAWYLNGCPGLTQFDLVLMDEAQDANACHIASLAYASRACYVGDAAQQIFSFKAAQDAMLKVPGRVYPLSLSFRFGQGIAEAANKVIACRHRPTEVRLKGLPGKESFIGAMPKDEGQTRIFRTNVSVIREALTLDDLGVSTRTFGDMSELKAKIEGAFSLLKGTIQEIRHPAFKQFRNWDELENWMYANQNTEISHIGSLVKQYARRIDSLIKVCNRRNTAGKVNLLNAHQAKGCEFDNVVIGQDFDQALEGLLLNGRSKSPQADEELNLLYVGLTRTRRRLEVKSEALRSIIK